MIIRMCSKRVSQALWKLFFVAVFMGLGLILYHWPDPEKNDGAMIDRLVILAIFTCLGAIILLSITCSKIIIDDEGIRIYEGLNAKRGINWDDVYKTHVDPEFIRFKKRNKKRFFFISVINYKKELQRIIDAIPDRIKDHMALDMLNEVTYKQSDEYKDVIRCRVFLILLCVLYSGYAIIGAFMIIKWYELRKEEEDLVKILWDMEPWGMLLCAYTAIFIIARRWVWSLCPDENDHWAPVGEEEAAPSPPK